MRICVSFFALASVSLFFFLTPVFVYADRCDDVMDEANKIYESAKLSFNQKKYEESARRYKSAEKYYRAAAKMKNCRCPKIEGNAKKYTLICRDRLNTLKEYLERYQEPAGNSSEHSASPCGRKSLVTVSHSDGTVEEYCE